mmetsp:Transcript_59713/g.136960  ORF Transcript_59713/g.136960 Transcript_59713/m.136960 type:complete len:338 (-) Transcript_59713:361-1374(-)
MRAAPTARLTQVRRAACSSPSCRASRTGGGTARLPTTAARSMMRRCALSSARRRRRPARPTPTPQPRVVMWASMTWCATRAQRVAPATARATPSAQASRCSRARASSCAHSTHPPSVAGTASACCRHSARVCSPSCKWRHRWHRRSAAARAVACRWSLATSVALRCRQAWCAERQAALRGSGQACSTAATGRLRPSPHRATPTPTPPRATPRSSCATPTRRGAGTSAPAALAPSAASARRALSGKPSRHASSSLRAWRTCSSPCISPISSSSRVTPRRSSASRPEVRAWPRPRHVPCCVEKSICFSWAGPPPTPSPPSWPSTGRTWGTPRAGPPRPI